MLALAEAGVSRHERADMESLWSDEGARAHIADGAKAGISEDLALRVYTSRLIGAVPDLVMHGGGNTSVKTRMRDVLGRDCEVICVKGSGWDLATIEAAGLPALHLTDLGEARRLETLGDAEMVALLRSNLLDPYAPNPSVETLLHAFLPATFVDHTHASAILAVSDQPNGDEICRGLFGDRLAYVPYVMPGFDLAKAVAAAVDAAPDVEGVLLHKHGLFTFGDTARVSYERMIEFVTIAEEAIDKAPDWVARLQSLPEKPAAPAEIAPILRGAAATPHGAGRYARLIAEFRTSNQIRAFVDGADVADYGTRGVITPDHIIRTKNRYLIAPPAAAGDLDGFRARIVEEIAAYRARYESYFENNNARSGGTKKKLDSGPRVILVPGAGLFGLGASSQAAGIAADLAEQTVDVIIKAERIGRFEPLGEADLFEMEYWSLEQAKLGKAKPKPLAGQIAVITGAGGAIGAATARLFAANGAEVALLDIDHAAAMRVAGEVGGAALALACDVTDQSSVNEAYAAVCRRFGGVDILVSNAGAAWESPIATMDDALLRKSFEINFFAHQRMARGAVGIMRRQGTGGALLFNVSKQAVNPGPNFGAYGLPKAASLFLVRQYAIECGGDGVRANAVNADKVRSGLLTDDFIAARAKSRGLDVDTYMRGNLLGLEVTAEDVAQAFLNHALALKTTGDVTTVDGGNAAAMLR